MKPYTICGTPPCAGEYVGTFRWSTKKDFKKLPPIIGALPSLETMSDYVGGRLEPESDGNVVVEAATIDGRLEPESDGKVVVEAATIDGVSNHDDGKEVFGAATINRMSIHGGLGMGDWVHVCSA
eukprot:gene7842-1045_t